MWWRRSSYAVLKNARLAALEAVFDAAENVGLEAAICGHLAVSIMFFEKPCFFEPFDEVYVSDVDALIKTFMQRHRDARIFSYSGNVKFIFFNYRLIKLKDIKIANGIRTVRVCSWSSERQILLFLQLEKLCSFPFFLMGSHRLMLTGFYESFPLGIRARVNIFIRKKLYNFFYAFGFKNVADYFRFKKLKLKEFRSLTLQSNDPLHRLVRQSSLKLVTDDFKLQTLGQMVDFYRDNNNIAKIKSHCYRKVSPIDTTYPLHYNLDFWAQSNAYYFLPIISGFRLNIPDYASAADPEVLEKFTFQYYLAQPKMKLVDIAQLFENSSPIVDGTAVVSGRHRFCAMIGHLALNGNYHPIKVAFF